MKKILAFILITLCLTSCTGREPNNVAYVVALGLDYAKNGNYVMTIQFARPTQISGGASIEGGKSGNQIVENLAVEAPNIYAGLGVANHILSKKLSLAHAKIIVMSAEVAKDGIKDIMETLARNSEIRPDIYLSVARKSAREYLYMVKPVVEVNPAKYYQLIYEQKTSYGVPTNTSIDFYFNQQGEGRDNVLPLAGVISDVSQQEESSSEKGKSEGNEGENPQKQENKSQQEAPFINDGFEYKLRNYIAGEVAINEGNKSETMGMVVFKDDKAKMTVGAVETELYKILSGDIRETYLTLKSDTDEPVTLKVTQMKMPAIKIDKENKEVNITVFLESDLYSLPADYIIEEKIEDFENTAKKEIEDACNKFIGKVIKKNRFDILGFKNKAKKLYLTNDDFKRHRDEVMDYDIVLDVRFYIRRTGLTVRGK